MESPSQALYELLCQQAPKQVLSCSQSRVPALQNYCEEHSDCDLLQLQPPGHTLPTERYDLAIVADCLEHLQKADGIQLLAQLRNLHSHHIWVLIDQRSDWQLTDFIALGFQRLQHFEDQRPTPEQRHYTSYGYEIGSYNRERSWNNAQFWANPQNFGKYWW